MELRDLFASESVLSRSQTVLKAHNDCCKRVNYGPETVDFPLQSDTNGADERLCDLKTRLHGEEYIRYTYEKAAHELRDRVAALEGTHREMTEEVVDLRRTLMQEREFRGRLELVGRELVEKAEGRQRQIEQLERLVEDRESTIRRLNMTTMDLDSLQSENESLQASISAIRIIRNLAVCERDRLLEEGNHTSPIPQTADKSVETESKSPPIRERNSASARKSKTRRKPDPTSRLFSKQFGSRSTAAIYLKP